MVFFTIFNYYSISLFLGGVIALISGLLPYLDNNKKPENKAWLFLNVSSAIWSFGYYFMITASNHQVGLVSNYVLHGAAVFIPLFYFLFILQLTQQFQKRKKIFYFASVISFSFFIINPLNIFIKDVIPKFIFNYVPEPGFMYIYFTAYFFLLVIFSIYILYKAQLNVEREKTIRLRFVLVSSLIGFTGGGSVFLLTYNLIPPYLLILFALYPIIITYAMIKHHLMNIKVILTEFFMSLLWLLLLFRIFLFETFQDQIIAFGVFLASLFFGIFVIKSVVREVETREEIERLAKDLQRANSQLKELDQRKSEFLSLASHQLRTPLTAIKGYSSMLLEGSFGEVSEKPRDAISRIFESSKHLVFVIQDFLTISRIEQNRLKYNFETTDLAEIVRTTIDEMRVASKDKGIKISLDLKLKNVPIHADTEKIKQVLGNLIDNAIKYTPKGAIKVSLSVDKEKSKAILSVSDSGVGMSQETIDKLFKKFSRADDASKINVSGSGLGLYVAKLMVEAHKGTIRAESDGDGKGSTFIVELPLDRVN